MYTGSIFCFRGARNGTLPPIDKSEFLEARPRGSAVSLLNTLKNILYSFIFIFAPNQVRPFHSLINLSLLPAHILYIYQVIFFSFYFRKLKFTSIYEQRALQPMTQGTSSKLEFLTLGNFTARANNLKFFF